MPNFLFETHRDRWIGFLIAPIAPLIFLDLIAVFSTGRLGSIFQGGGFVFIVSYLSMLIVGLPISYLLDQNKKYFLSHYIIAGLVASFVPIFIILIFPFIPNFGENLHARGGFFDAAPALFKVGSIMSVCGVLVSATYWLVTRPDKA